MLKGIWMSRFQHVAAAVLVLTLGVASSSKGQPASTPDNEDKSWGDESADNVGFAPPPPDNQVDEGQADQEGWNDANDDIGFGDSQPDENAASHEPPPSAQAGTLSATGFVRHRSGLWVEQLNSNALAQARTSLDGQMRYHKRFRWAGAPWTLRLVAGGHGEVDLAYFYNKQRFDDATIDMYRKRFIGGETYASIAQGPLELTVGRQIVPFGQGTMLTTLDVVNPRDLREPGLADIEDMRIAVLGSRAGVFLGYHRLEFLMVHEAYFGLRPPPVSFFSPIKPLLLTLPPALVPHQYTHQPKRFSIDGQQYYVRYAYAGPGADVALYGGSTLDQIGLPVLSTFNQLAAMAQNGQAPKLELLHRRYLMAGASAAVPLGAIVLRGEAGIDVNRPIGLVEPVGSVGADDPLFYYAFREQLNWMAGVTYTGISNASVSLEYAGRYVFNNPARLLRPSLADLGLLYRHDLFDERIRLTMAAGTFGLFYHYQGMFGRLEVDYAFDNGLRTGIGYVTYQPYGDDQLAALTGFNRNDRAYVTLRWDFMLD